MQEMDEKICKEIKNNCQEWLNKKSVSDDVV